MTAALVEGYGWLSEPWPAGLGEAGCVTVAAPATRAAILDAFAADPDERIGLVDAAVLAVPHVAVGETAEGVVAVECNGSEGSRAEVLERASRAGKAANVFWSVNGMVTFACARRGRMLCWVDLLLDQDPDELPARLRRLLPADRADADLVAVGAAMAEAFTGVAIPAELVAAAETGNVVHPRIDKLYTETVEDCTLRHEHPQLVTRLAAAPGPVRRAIAEWSAIQQLRHVGLLEDEAVQSVVARFGVDAPAPMTVQFLQRAGQIHREQDRAHARFAAVQNNPHVPCSGEELAYHWAIQRSWAMRATRYACTEDDLSAVLGAVADGASCFAWVEAKAAFTVLVDQLIDLPRERWPDEPDELPTPLTDQQRAEKLDWEMWIPRAVTDTRVLELEPWQRGHRRLRLLRSEYDPYMIDNLVWYVGQRPEPEQRAIALWAARHALAQSGLDQLDWVAPALAALEHGQSLPPPFDDPDQAWARLAADPDAPHSYVDAFDEEGRDHQQSMALPVLAAAALPNTGLAALNAIWYAALTAGSDCYDTLLPRLHETFDR